jgi:hypothetical protein
MRARPAPCAARTQGSEAAEGFTTPPRRLEALSGHTDAFQVRRRVEGARASHPWGWSRSTA